MIDFPLLILVATDAAGQGGSPLILIVMLALLLLLVFTTFRRGRKVRQAQQEAHTGAVIGAEVITAGGIVGVVVARDEEKQRLTLEFSTGDRMDVLLAAVQQISTPAVSETPATDPSAPETTQEQPEPPSGDEYGSPEERGSDENR